LGRQTVLAFDDRFLNNLLPEENFKVFPSPNPFFRFSALKAGTNISFSVESKV
jgi:hypothetical protein